MSELASWCHVKFLVDDVVSNVRTDFFKSTVDGTISDPTQLKEGEVYKVFWSPDISETPMDVLSKGNRILDVDDLAELEKKRRDKRKVTPLLKGYFNALLLDLRNSEDSFEDMTRTAVRSGSRRVHIPSQKVTDMKAGKAVGGSNSLTSLNQRNAATATKEKPKKSGKQNMKESAAEEASCSNMLSLLSNCASSAPNKKLSPPKGAKQDNPLTHKNRTSVCKLSAEDSNSLSESSSKQESGHILKIVKAEKAVNAGSRFKSKVNSKKSDRQKFKLAAEAASRSNIISLLSSCASSASASNVHISPPKEKQCTDKNRTSNNEGSDPDYELPADSNSSSESSATEQESISSTERLTIVDKVNKSTSGKPNVKLSSLMSSCASSARSLKSSTPSGKKGTDTQSVKNIISKCEDQDTTCELSEDSHPADDSPCDPVSSDADYWKKKYLEAVMQMQSPKKERKRKRKTTDFQPQSFSYQQCGSLNDTASEMVSEPATSNHDGKLSPVDQPTTCNHNTGSEVSPVDQLFNICQVTKKRVKPGREGDSLFVTNEAARFWKPHVLVVRSPTGLPATNAQEKVPYPKLTPQKVNKIKESLYNRIKHENPQVSNDELRERLGKVDYILGQKISSTRRTFQRRQITYPTAAELNASNKESSP